MKDLVIRDTTDGGYYVDGRQFKTIEEVEAYLHWRNRLKSDWSDRFKGTAYYARSRDRLLIQEIVLVVLLTILVVLLCR